MTNTLLSSPIGVILLLVIVLLLIVMSGRYVDLLLKRHSRSTTKSTTTRWYGPRQNNTTIARQLLLHVLVAQIRELTLQFDIVRIVLLCLNVFVQLILYLIKIVIA